MFLCGVGVVAQVWQRGLTGPQVKQVIENFDVLALLGGHNALQRRHILRVLCEGDGDHFAWLDSWVRQHVLTPHNSFCEQSTHRAPPFFAAHAAV